MPYSHTTLAQLSTQLANRLGDSGGVFWTPAERARLVREALRSWNLAALYFRDRGTFSTAAGTAFYDLGTHLDNGGSKILERTLTDADLFADIKYHLVEPSPADVTTFSDQFTQDDITQALQRRRNQFLLETSQIHTAAETGVVQASTPRVSLSDSVLDVKRAAWKTPTYVDQNGSTVPDQYANLQLTDEHRLNAQFPGWALTPGTPSAYTTVLQPNLQLQLVPVPQDSGRLHLITADAGAALNPATGVALGVAQDSAPVVKWGALADLLSKDGPARDARRAEYCEGRWKEGVELSKVMVSAAHAELNGRPAHVSSLFDLDAHVPGWQHSSGAPEAVALSGQNLLALYSVPDGVYSVTLDVVRNAVVPSEDGNYVQIGREFLDVLLDYAVHLAMFKCGGQAFADTMPLYERFMKAAAAFNSKLAERAESFEVLRDKSQRGERQRFAA
ncbi:MAG: hypothetical protein M3416_05415 [Acidobacteriota bacterium]|nr:hypothetical protein [Acidobacteriota bacterium]